MCKWCADDDSGAGLLDENPCTGIKMPFRYGERERWLSADEIRWFWQAAGEEGYPVGTIARLLLLTGQRRSAIANLQKHQVDRVTRRLTIPIWRDKSKRGHLVPLSDLAMGILDDSPRWPACPLIFSTDGQRQVSERSFTLANRRIHARMLELSGQEIARAGRDPDEAGVEWFCYHDLRRTSATVMCELGHPLYVVDKVLNHAGGQSGTGRTITSVTRIYIKYEYIKERAAALQGLADFVSSLVTADTSAAAVVDRVPTIVRLPALRSA
jgi:integrase